MPNNVEVGVNSLFNLKLFIPIASKNNGIFFEILSPLTHRNIKEHKACIFGSCMYVSRFSNPAARSVLFLIVLASTFLYSLTLFFPLDFFVSSSSFFSLSNGKDMAAECHSFFVYFHIFLHTFLYINFFYCKQTFKPRLPGQDLNLGCLSASKHTTNWATPHPMSYATLSELGRTLLSYATLLSYTANYWTMPPSPELRRTLLSYVAPYWATPRPAKLCCTLLRYAAPYWATPYPTELCRTLLSYAAPCWAMPQPSDLRRTLLRYTVPCWATPHPVWAKPHPYQSYSMLHILGYAALFHTLFLPDFVAF